MPKRLALGCTVLAAFVVLGRATKLVPFQAPHPRWSLQEDYTQNQILPSAFVRQSHSAPSLEGLVIGVDGPGFVEWRFLRPGPFPTIIQPYFVPSSSGRLLL